MNRFVAMLWDARAKERSKQVQGWTETLQRRSARWSVVLDAPGLRVLSFTQRDYQPTVVRMEGVDGIVVGVLFERGHEAKGCIRSLSKPEATRIAATDGSELVRNYWGSYVALWRKPGADSTTVLRDPCGAVSCFMTRSGEIDLLFSYTDDVASLPGLQFSIDWRFIQAFLRHSHFITGHTGLNEISEILAGQRMRWDARHRTNMSWSWNAASIATQPSRQSFVDARSEMREITTSSFAAWGKTYRRIAVQLSGGLDSSILVNLLRRVSDADVVGMHFVGSGYEAYELKLARLAAKNAGIDLVEIPVDPEAADLRALLDIPRLARPTAQILGRQADNLVAQTCERIDADSIMAGHGGDSIFLERSVAAHTLEDYVRLNGFGPDFLRVAYEAAMLQELPIWQFLKNVFRSMLGRREWRPFAFLDRERKYSLLSPEITAKIDDSYTSHPWFIDAARLPIGKAEQIRCIVALNNYYMVQGSGVERDAVNPYISQPVVEFALRTPTYQFSRGGVDRALEREAFAHLIPNEVMRRSSKGFINHHLLIVARRNIDFLRELVLDGALVQHAWIDRVQVERVFTRERFLRGDGMASAYNLIAAEAWLRSWNEGPPQIRNVA